MSSNKVFLWVAVPATLVLILAFATAMFVPLQRPLTMMGFSTSPGTAIAPMMSGEAGAIMIDEMEEQLGRGAAYDDGYGSDGDRLMMMPIPPSEPSTAGVTAAQADQKIIKTGYLDLQVTNVGESVTKMSALAEGKGGFVQTSSVSEREDGTHYGSIIIRVPSNVYEETLAEMKSLAAVVRTESSTGQDVTEQYTDLEAQLRNAQAQEAQYLEILERANTVEEILMVQPYIDSVRGTINYLTGRIQYLENATSYSTISASLSEEPSVRVPSKEFRFGDIINQAAQSLVSVGQGIAIFAVWFVIVGGPFLVILIMLVIALKIGLNKWLK